MATYAQEQSSICFEKLRELSASMPSFFNSYIMDKERTMQPRSILAYAYDLRRFFLFLSERLSLPVIDITCAMLDNVTTDELSLYLSSLDDKKDGMHIPLSAHASARYLAAIRSLYTFLYRKNLLSNNPAILMDNARQKKHEVRVFSDRDMEGIAEALDYGNGMTDRQRGYSEKHIFRDQLIILLLMGTGMRVSELVGIDLGDLSNDYTSVLIHRKGGNTQRIYLGEDATNAITDYITLERDAEGSETPNALILTGVGTFNNRMTVKSVERLVRRYTNATDVARRATPHYFRRSFGTKVYEETGDIKLVADILGHSDIQTTNKYYSKTSINRQKEIAGLVGFTANKES